MSVNYSSRFSSILPVRNTDIIIIRLIEKGDLKKKNDDTSSLFETNDDTAPSSPKKKRKTTSEPALSMKMATSNRNTATISAGSTLSHMAYRVDFHHLYDSRPLWSSNASEKEKVKALLHNASSFSSGKSHGSSMQHTSHLGDSKVIVVLELPSGGEVSQFAVDGDEDNELTVKVNKHQLTFNPHAITFAGISCGILSAKTDGPETARGGVRVNECGRALKKMQMDNKVENNGKFSFPVHIKLPASVDVSSCKHFTHCFDKSEDNPMQQVFSYWEWDVKIDRVQDRFQEGATVTYSGSNDGGQGGGNHDCNKKGNNQNGNSSGTAGGHGCSNHQQSSSTSHSHSGAGAHRRRQHANKNDDNEDDTMEDINLMSDGSEDEDGDDDYELAHTTFTQQDLDRAVDVAKKIETEKAISQTHRLKDIINDRDVEIMNLYKEVEAKEKEIQSMASDKKMLDKMNDKVVDELRAKLKEERHFFSEKQDALDKVEREKARLEKEYQSLYESTYGENGNQLMLSNGTISPAKRRRTEGGSEAVVSTAVTSSGTPTTEPSLPVVDEIMGPHLDVNDSFASGQVSHSSHSSSVITDESCL